MTDITLVSGNALNTLDSRASQAAALADLARSVRSGQAISLEADGFSVFSDRIGIARSAGFAADIQATMAATTNATHAVSLLSTAAGALADIAYKLNSLADIAQDAADPGLSSADRVRLDVAFQTIRGEIDATAADTQFDGAALLDGALQIDYRLGTGSADGNRLDIRIGDASTAGLSAALATADLTTAANAASAVNAVADAQAALGSIQGTVAGDLTRVGSAYRALQNQAAVDEKTRGALAGPVVAADLAQHTADQVKAQSRLPLMEDVDRRLVSLLGQLETTTQAESGRVTLASAHKPAEPQPLTPEPAAAAGNSDR